jgi:hypothetical protein
MGLTTLAIPPLKLTSSHRPSSSRKPRSRAIYAFLRACTFPVEDLNAASTGLERCRPRTLQGQKRAGSQGAPTRSRCDQRQASGRPHIGGLNMGESLSCSSRSLHRNYAAHTPLRTDAANSQRPGHAAACRHACRDGVLGCARDHLEALRLRHIRQHSGPADGHFELRGHATLPCMVSESVP